VTSDSFRAALRVVVAGLDGWGAAELASQVHRVGADVVTWMRCCEDDERERRAALAPKPDPRTPRDVTSES
jgi:hypothetical protein